MLEVLEAVEQQVAVEAEAAEWVEALPELALQVKEFLVARRLVLPVENQQAVE